MPGSKFKKGDIVNVIGTNILRREIEAVLPNKLKGGYNYVLHQYTGMFRDDELELYKQDKVIYFHPFAVETPTEIIPDYVTTRTAIFQEKKPVIHTYSMMCMSMSLIEHGYKIYIVSRQGKVTEIREHMPEINRDIRMAHNIKKMFAAGTFDDILFD